ncbi:MAG TPA: MATE family efflux transporter [Flavisolibacter sp.]
MTERLQFDTGYRQILKIALPIGLALLVPQLNYLINNIFLGRFSREALATGSITGVYYLIFAGIGFGLNNGLQSLISRRAGENRPEEIGRIFNQGIFISMAVAVFGILVTWFVAPLIFRYTIQSPEVYEDTVEFLRIRIFGLLFLYVYQMRNALLVGINQSRLLVIGTLAEAVANVVLDYGFIFGKLGLPAMGFNGAAVASVIAEFTGMFVIYLVIRNRGISKRFSLFGRVRYNREITGKIVSVSGPLAFQHAISIISWFFFFVLVEHHGEKSMAVSNSMRNVFGFFGAFIWAFASTTNAMVSNVIGQGRKDDVMKLISRIMLLSSGVAMAVFIFLNVFPEVFLAIYGQKSDFLELGIPVVRVVSFAVLLMSIATVWLHAVTGTGNGRMTFLIELVSIILYCVYAYAVLEVNKMSIIWGWGSELLYWSVLFLLSFAYMKSNRWRKMVI